MEELKAGKLEYETVEEFLRRNSVEERKSW